LASACGIAAIALYYLAGKLGRIGNFLWLGLCLVGFIPHVANTEHVVGLLLGVVWGFVRSGGWGQMRRRRRWYKQLS